MIHIFLWLSFRYYDYNLNENKKKDFYSLSISPKNLEKKIWKTKKPTKTGKKNCWEKKKQKTLNKQFWKQKKCEQKHILEIFGGPSKFVSSSHKVSQERFPGMAPLCTSLTSTFPSNLGTDLPKKRTVYSLRQKWYLESIFKSDTQYPSVARCTELSRMMGVSKESIKVSRLIRASVRGRVGWEGEPAHVFCCCCRIIHSLTTHVQ